MNNSYFKDELHLNTNNQNEIKNVIDTKYSSYLYRRQYIEDKGHYDFQPMEYVFHS